MTSILKRFADAKTNTYFTENSTETECKTQEKEVKLTPRDHRVLGYFVDEFVKNGGEPIVISYANLAKKTRYSSHYAYLAVKALEGRGFIQKHSGSGGGAISRNSNEYTLSITGGA